MAVVNLIKIEGLREFNTALKRMDSDLPKAVRLASNEAADIIVKAAKPKVPTGPGKGGHAKSSIKAASTRTAARIAGGGKKFPYYAWLDFGGKVGRNHSVRRPFMREGRYIWKSYSDNRDQVQDKMVEALTEVARTAGLDAS